jgi:hypothetical protein
MTGPTGREDSLIDCTREWLVLGCWPMISPGRITKVFPKKGRSGQPIQLGCELAGGQLSPILNDSNGDQPLLVNLRPELDWFALTKHRLVMQGAGKLRKIPLHEIRRANDIWTHARVKQRGGDLFVRLGDGSLEDVGVESDGPCVAMHNPFLYPGQGNRPSTRRAESGVEAHWPATNDRRPTAQS